jgi:hypothetical protein
MRIARAEANAAQSSLEPPVPCHDEVASWETRFKCLLPLYGHRNWIVVADAAYPAQSNPGIETLSPGRDHTEVLGKVRSAIGMSMHVRANFYLDAELKLVTEKDAPGRSALCEELTRLLAGKNTREFTHEEIITRLNQAGKLFRILILKSTFAIPYTSGFLEPDCGYWSEEAEKRLRAVQVKETAGVFQTR